MKVIYPSFASYIKQNIYNNILPSYSYQTMSSSLPAISNISVKYHDTLHFTLSNVNVSFANALRRTILSDIPINVIRTETHDINKCKIFVNTSRLHNEIIKQRLSCIPIHTPPPTYDLDYLPQHYLLEVNVSNDTENTIYVTTEDFVLKPKTDTTTTNTTTPTDGNDDLLRNAKELSRQVFPKNTISDRYIDFARLRGKIDNNRGEKLHLQAEFSIATAKENSMFNVASICTYSNTLDSRKIDDKWAEEQQKLTELDEQELLFRKKNFYILDAQRCFIEDSFDFILKSVGVYENKYILVKACQVLIENFQRLYNSVTQKEMTFVKNENVTVDECYDFHLHDLDCYTYGKCLEAVYYKNYFLPGQIVFCGFKKFHPHDANAILRIVYGQPVDETKLVDDLRIVINQCVQVFQQIQTKVNEMIA